MVGTQQKGIEMKVSGFRCDICGSDFVAVQYAAVPAPSKFTASTLLPGSAGYSWEFNEICENCELEIRKAINVAVASRKIKEDEE
jgi:hypothetical protein